METNWEAAYSYGTHAQSHLVQTSAQLQSNHWYYLLLVVGEGGDFYTLLWEQGNTSQYLINITNVPPGDNWDNRNWSFELQGSNGARVLVESYEELTFPSGYEMPDTPPS